MTGIPRRDRTNIMKEEKMSLGCRDSSVKYVVTGNVDKRHPNWYDEKYYKSSPVKNLQGSCTGEKHVLQGGSLNDHT